MIIYKLSPLYSGSAQKLRVQNVAEKSLPIYLLMSNYGSRSDVDNKPSVSETSLKNVCKKCIPKEWAQKTQVLRKKPVCGSNQLFGSSFSH